MKNEKNVKFLLKNANFPFNIMENCSKGLKYAVSGHSARSHENCQSPRSKNLVVIKQFFLEFSFNIYNFVIIKQKESMQNLF